MDIILKLKDELKNVQDPRVLGRTKHKLIDILVLTTIAIICQAETWEDIEEFGHGREDWLSKFLDLPGGIPSHDTILRVFSLIEPREFEIAFINWVNNVREKNNIKDTICIDGKTLGGTFSVKEGKGRKCLTLINVWSTELGLALGQLKSKSTGSSEKNAAMELLNHINIEGLNIVADAGIGSSKFANKIIEKKGGYTFPIKKNSKILYNGIDRIFSNIAEKNSQSRLVENFSIDEKGHGRKEKRSCTIIRQKNFPEGFNTKGDGSAIFEKLNVIGRIVYESEEKETRPHVQKDGKYTTTTDKVRKKKEVRYFISSLSVGIKKQMEELRKQWKIENQLHWVLDVGLGEDGNRTRNKVAAENLATVRKIALNLAKQDKTSKSGVRRKLKKASWNTDYLEFLLFRKTLS